MKPEKVVWRPKNSGASTAFGYPGRELVSWHKCPESCQSVCPVWHVGSFAASKPTLEISAPKTSW